MRNRLRGSYEQTGRLGELDQCSIGLDDPSFQKHQTCLFGPERYEPRYDYPLVIWLHSCDSSERELENVMPALSTQNYVGCAPRGTVACDCAGHRFRWGNGAASVAIAEEVVFDAAELAKAEFSIASNRIFLAGFGGGGTMAWRIGLRYPQRFAGIISIGGGFPRDNHPLTNYENARDLATLWMYGAESTSCGIEHVCESLPLLHSASLAVDIRQYPCGDELLTNMLSDSNSWIMEQVTNQPTSTELHSEPNFSRN